MTLDASGAKVGDLVRHPLPGIGAAQIDDLEGLTVAEAMWKGAPVIGGNVGGIRIAQRRDERLHRRLHALSVSKRLHLLVEVLDMLASEIRPERIDADAVGTMAAGTDLRLCGTGLGVAPGVRAGREQTQREDGQRVDEPFHVNAGRPDNRMNDARVRQDETGLVAMAGNVGL